MWYNMFRLKVLTGPGNVVCSGKIRQYSFSSKLDHLLEFTRILLNMLCAL